MFNHKRAAKPSVRGQPASAGRCRSEVRAWKPGDDSTSKELHLRLLCKKKQVGQKVIFVCQLESHAHSYQQGSWCHYVCVIRAHGWPPVTTMLLFCSLLFRQLYAHFHLKQRSIQNESKCSLKCGFVRALHHQSCQVLWYIKLNQQLLWHENYFLVSLEASSSLQQNLPGAINKVTFDLFFMNY